MAAGHRAGQPQHMRRDDRDRLHARHRRRPHVARQHAGQAAGAEQAGQVRRGRRQRAAVGDRQVRPVLPGPRAEPVAVRHGGADLAERQQRRSRSRRVLCGLRQPDAGVGRAGGRPAKLGDRREHIPLAGTPLGRLPRRPQPRVPRHHLHPAGRPGPRPVASAGRRLHPPARRLGAVRRSRRGGHEVRGRRARHDRRRLNAEPVGQRPPVRRPARGAGRDRLRQQRRTAQRGQPDLQRRRCCGLGAGRGGSGSVAGRCGPGGAGPGRHPGHGPARPRAGHRGGGRDSGAAIGAGSHGVHN